MCNSQMDLQLCHTKQLALAILTASSIHKYAYKEGNQPISAYMKQKPAAQFRFHIVLLKPIEFKEVSGFFLSSK